jgi:hypothetical protein
MPLDQLGTLRVQPRPVLMVENLETGLAVPNMPGVIVFMKLGTSVSVLASLPWVTRARVLPRVDSARLHELPEKAPAQEGDAAVERVSSMATSASRRPLLNDSNEPMDV